MKLTDEQLRIVAEDGLVERLREAAAVVRDTRWGGAMPNLAHGLDEAAARIERQAQEIERVKRMRAEDNRISTEVGRDLIAERDAALRLAEALREALRREVIGHSKSADSGPWVLCRLCTRKWSGLDSERHAEGCLASPAETKE